MLEKRARIGSSVLPCVALLSACVPAVSSGPEPVVRYYVPPTIIVGGRSQGKFAAVNGCIFYDLHREPPLRLPAVFPPGTKLSADHHFILLPNGRSIPFNKRVTISGERPPNPIAVDQTCGPNPIQVADIVVTE